MGRRGMGGRVHWRRSVGLKEQSSSADWIPLQKKQKNNVGFDGLSALAVAVAAEKLDAS